MPTELINILVQVPLIAAFIWFVLELTKRNQEAMDHRDIQMQTFLKEQREADRAILGQLSEEIRDFRTDFLNHDRKTDNAITSMQERTRPRTDK
jgi:hypothetical protein